MPATDLGWRWIHLLVFVLVETARCQGIANQGVSCRLPDAEVGSLLEDSRTWRVTDTILEDHDLQDIIDCTNEGDTVALKTTQRIQPRSCIEIAWNLTIDGTQSGRNRSSRAAITCPSDTEGLFLIKAASVSFKGLHIQACELSEEGNVTAIIETEGCASSDDQPTLIRMFRVTFENNVNRNGSAGVYINDPSCYTLVMENIEFQSNLYRRASQLSCQNELKSVQLFKNKFLRSNNSESSLIAFPQESNSTVRDLIAKENKGTVLGLYNAVVTISNSNFSRNSEKERGVIRGTYSTLFISSSLFNFNSCNGSGAATSLFGGSNATFSSVRFINNSALSDGGAVYLEGSQNVLIQSCVFRSNKAVNENNTLFGGAFSVSFSEEMNLTVANSVFRKNSGYAGGGAAIYRSTGALIFKSTSFQRNVAQFGGGLFVLNNLTQQLDVLLENVTYSGNTAREGGAIRVRGEAVGMDIVGSKFLNNNASYIGGAMEIISLRRLAITDGDFNGNTAGGNGGALDIGSIADRAESRIEIHATITASRFVRNTAYRGGSLKSESAVNLTDCKFERNQAGGWGGAAFLEGALLRAVFHGSHFVKNKAVVGGAIAATSGVFHYNEIVRMDVEACSFEENTADAYGGAIYVLIKNNEDVYHLSNSTLVRNNATVGGGLYVQVDSSNSESDTQIVQMNGTTFKENYAERAGGACFIENLDALVTDCKLDPAAPFSANADALSDNFYCDSMLDNAVGSGGYGPNIAASATSFYAILFPEDREGTQLGAGSVEEIGYLKSGDVFPLVEVVMVDHFHQGPALAKTRTGLPEIQQASSQRHLQTESFAKATVDSDDDLIPNQLITDVSNGTGNITVGELRQRPGAYALVVWTGDDKSVNATLNIHLRTCNINEESTQDEKLCILCDANHYNFDPVKANCSLCPANCDCCSWGIMPNKHHWIPAPCNPNVTECLSSRACDYDGREKRMTEFLTKNAGRTCELNDSYLAEFRIRQCNNGSEGLLCGSCSEGYGEYNLRCFRCAATVFIVLWLVAITAWNLGTCSFNVVGNLTDIRADVRTLKRANMHVKKGSTSSTATQSSSAPASVSITRLQVSDSAREESAQGISRGQQQVGELEICVDCAGDGSLDNRSNSLCADVESQLSPRSVVPGSQLTGGGVSNSSNSTRTCSTRDADEANQTAVHTAKRNVTETVKLFLNFAQVNGMALTINTNWTRLMEIALRTLSSLGSIPVEITFSLDCLFSKSSSVPRSIYKVVISMLPPFVVLIMMAGFWLIRFLEDLPTLRRRLVLSAVVVFYVSYIGWAKILSSTLHCVTVDDGMTITRYWTRDTSVECFVGSHAVLTYSMVVPMIVIALLAFPVGSALYLWENKKANKLSDKAIKERIGFMYIAYKKECFYWDCIVMLRKAALALAIVFGASLGVNMQSLISICILGFSLYLQTQFSPFNEDFQAFNLIEVFSLLVSHFTFISGLFLNDERISQTGRLLVSLAAVSLIFGYVVFVLYVLFRKSAHYCRLALEHERQAVVEETCDIKVSFMWVKEFAKLRRFKTNSSI